MNCQVKIHFALCLMGAIIIKSNGDLQLCQGYSLGNINNTTIQEAWNSTKIEYFRKISSEHQIMPTCFRCCELKIKFWLSSLSIELTIDLSKCLKIAIL